MSQIHAGGFGRYPLLHNHIRGAGVPQHMRVNLGEPNARARLLDLHPDVAAIQFSSRSALKQPLGASENLTDFLVERGRDRDLPHLAPLANQSDLTILADPLTVGEANLNHLRHPAACLEEKGDDQPCLFARDLHHLFDLRFGQDLLAANAFLDLVGRHSLEGFLDGQLPGYAIPAKLGFDELEQGITAMVERRGREARTDGFKVGVDIFRVEGEAVVRKEAIEVPNHRRIGPLGVLAEPLTLTVAAGEGVENRFIKGVNLMRWD